MIIYIKTINAKYAIDVDCYDSIEEVKLKFEKISKIPVEDQRLIFAGK